MWQMVFANVLIEGWNIDSYVYWLCYSSSEVLVIPPHYTKIVNCCCFTCNVAVVIDRRGDSEVFFWTSLLKFLMMLQYTLYHTCVCKSPHFSEWWILCLWEPPGCFWLSFLLQSTTVSHVFCKHFWNFHTGLWYMELLNVLFLIEDGVVFFWWLSLLVLLTGCDWNCCLSSSYSRPTWDIFI